MKKLSVYLFSIFISSHSVFAGDLEDLFTASMQCDVAGVQRALDAGVDVNSINPASNQNALAAAFFCPEVTKLLLAKGCDPNGGSYPAIISAANCYSTEVMKILLEGGADPNAVGTIDPGLHLRTLAAKEREKGKKANKAMIDAWEAAANTVPPSRVTALQQTLQQTNCVPCLEMLLKAGADINNTEVDGGLIHTLAVFSMDKDMRKDGFTKGAPVMETMGMKVPAFYGNLTDDLNGTPAKMLDLLLGAGADVNAKRTDGVSALMVAMRLHKLDLSKEMVRKGADVVSESVAEMGKRKVKSYPICAAAEFADVELMQMILDKKPNIDVSVETIALGVTMDSNYGGNVTFGGDGYTPLIIAIMSGHTDVAKLLLDAGASVKIGSSGIAVLKSVAFFLNCLTEISNKTPIYWAVEQDDLDLVEKIAEKMEWKFNPDFTIKQYGPKDAIGSLIVQCASFKKKQSPSIYATTVGNSKAYGLLSAKGL
ncbi:MAG: ankyrin repeat domain-containing protein [Flavobacteriales bacterium]|nr:ankyrin repeat domain-containing protein [Flavobacteriales bacterium]